MNSKPKLKFDGVPIGHLFVHTNGWTYKRLPDNSCSKAGRAEFVSGGTMPAELVGKSCTFTKTSNIYSWTYTPGFGPKP